MKYDLEREDLISIIKTTDESELTELCKDIREFLIQKVSKTGGHLASNLGVVELTVAMHKVYDSPRDKLIYDVGHQTYVHKILTGRANQFDTLRKFKGLSGFPKAYESIHDAYDTGHSSTSLGAAAGYAVARNLKVEDHEVVALIGDGAMTGGLVYEALNNIGSNRLKVRIILNDNGMSIAHNVGAMSKHLQGLRSSSNYINAKKSVRTSLNKVPLIGRPISNGISRTKSRIKLSVLDQQGILFEELGIKYIGPIDGYNIPKLIEAFNAANAVDGPTLVHVITTKGKGYSWSEKYPKKFHGVGPFSVDDGNVLSSNPLSPELSFSEVFGNKLLQLAKADERIVAITAAMGSATGLGPFYEEFPNRFFDVGIAEQHAALFAAGLAKAGMVPVAPIYSSFLQRAYDQIIEDICIQNQHVVFGVDRAGLVGADGETHHGVFDLSYLSSIPNMTVFAPADGTQLEEMLEYAVKDINSPVAIRYPRGSAEFEHLKLKPFSGTNIRLSAGTDITILAVGSMLDTALEAARELMSKGYNVGVTNICVVSPFEDRLTDLDTKLVITIEDNVLRGGFGEAFASRALKNGYSYGLITLGVPDAFIEQGSVEQLRIECGMTASDIVKGATEYFERKA
nr:1-deoxy-D-xylulose-5-phosphate synthase [uncultured Mogibacterium sp.]